MPPTCFLKAQVYCYTSTNERLRWFQTLRITHLRIINFVTVCQFLCISQFQLYQHKTLRSLTRVLSQYFKINTLSIASVWRGQESFLHQPSQIKWVVSKITDIFGDLPSEFSRTKSKAIWRRAKAPINSLPHQSHQIFKITFFLFSELLKVY